MQLNQAALDEFKNLYAKQYRVKLTDQQALEYGTRLITFVKAVCGENLPKVSQNKLILTNQKDIIKLTTG
ncbi:hypothetical protein HYS03_01220 [Candidatus Woesebacteria bacterium]|nr:hypothetical protein [Candidatus Woesebacteria bacterium]QQG47570.1 MAG: hypothetical protein HY044_00560 [Candidatus Woesebacteria bacterium]